MSEWIDSRANLKLPLEQYSYRDLRKHYSTGAVITEGSGPYKTHSCRSGVQTDIGDIREALWMDLVEELIEIKGDQWLLKAFEEYFSANAFSKCWDKKKLKISALDSVTSELCNDKCWVGYLAFNEKYRPDVIAPEDRVMVVTDCRGKPAAATPELIAWDTCIHSGQITCPICGKLSPFRYADDPLSADEESKGEG